MKGRCRIGAAPFSYAAHDVTGNSITGNRDEGLILKNRNGFRVLAAKTDASAYQTLLRLQWEDKHKTRDQTWKVFFSSGTALAAAFSAQIIERPLEAFLASCLASLLASVGLVIAWHHRRVEQEKMLYIRETESRLGLASVFSVARRKDSLAERRLSKNSLADVTTWLAGFQAVILLGAVAFAFVSGHQFALGFVPEFRY